MGVWSAYPSGEALKEEELTVDGYRRVNLGREVPTEIKERLS